MPEKEEYDFVDFIWSQCFVTKARGAAHCSDLMWRFNRLLTPRLSEWTPQSKRLLNRFGENPIKNQFKNFRNPQFIFVLIFEIIFVNRTNLSRRTKKKLNRTQYWTPTAWASRIKKIVPFLPETSYKKVWWKRKFNLTIFIFDNIWNKSK